MRKCRTGSCAAGLAVEDMAVDFFDFVVTASIVDPKLTGTTFWPVLDFLHLAANGETGPLKEAIAQLHSDVPPPADFSAGLHVATLRADLPDAPWGDSSAPLRGRDALLAKAVSRLVVIEGMGTPPRAAIRSPTRRSAHSCSTRSVLNNAVSRWA